MKGKNAPEDHYAWTVKVGEKGQFVIPKEARDLFDIHPGDTLIVLAHKKRGIAIPPKSTFAGYAARIFGMDAFPQNAPETAPQAPEEES